MAGNIWSILLKSGARIAGAAVDAVVETIDIAANIDRAGLLRPPRSIKRALEWIACCCSNENKSGLEAAIKKLLGANDIEKLCELLGKLNVDPLGNPYDNAKWEDLCKQQGSGTSCCASTSGGNGGCSGCKGSGKSCDGCCYDCPKIVCARMFCMIIPIVSYFLEYLNEKCKEDWKGQKADGSNGNGATDLKNFLLACGFQTGDLTDADGKKINEQLKEILKAINDVKEELKKGCKNADSQQPTLTTPSAEKAGKKEPKTIRDMMLWLQGLLYCPQFHGLTKKIQTKCDELKKGSQDVTCEKVLDNLFDTAFCLPGMFLSVEGKFSDLLRDLLEGCFGYTNEQCFLYKQKDDDLFKQFCEYVHKVHTQLRFLKVMCKTGNEQGGWKDCKYGNGNRQCDCNSNVKTSCLKRFLEGESNGLDELKTRNGKNGENKFFGLVTTNSSNNVNDVGMGFKGKLYGANGKKGQDIYDFLKDLIDPINTESSPTTPSKPLSLLAQYCVAIGQLHPQSLGDFFAFFEKLGTEWDSLKLYGQNGEKFKTKLEAELTDYKIGQNGQQEACDQLKTAIKAILTTHSDHTNKKDLMSLMCNNSSGTNGCAPYMKSLSSGLYSFYAPQITGAGEREKFGVFQYLYDMLRKLLDQMKALKEAFEECECCKKGSSSSCPNLIQCQYAHPILYKFGFVFGDPSKLKSGKKCTDIKAQLDKVLSCTKGSESALFKAFECVIQVTYKVLLERAKACVTKKYNTSTNGDKPAEGLQSTNQEMNTAFMLYVSNAMYSSYPKLICTFACKVFDGEHDCKSSDCKTRFKDKAPGPEPKPRIAGSTSHDITVTSSTVTSISAVIPQYCQPVIDPYHYKTFNKEGTKTGSNGNSSTHYSFRDALDFHIKGAQCISPAPVALRSVIDWILRVTRGAIATKGDKENGKNNDNIKGLSDAIKSVFTTAGVTASDVNNDNIQSHLNSLVTGLRKFVGYQDKSQSVKEGVSDTLGTNGTNGVKGALQKKIEVLNNFIGEKGKTQFGTELGKALLKGRYAGTFKQKRDGLADTIISTLAFVTETITGIQEPLEQKTFKDVVGLFTKILSSTHEGCKELKCKSINSSASAPKSSEQKTGLEILKEFFQAVAKFNQWTYEIGDGHNNKSSSDIVLRTRQGAEKTVSGTAMNGTNGNNGNEKYKLYYKLVTALATLGGCTHLVEKLLKPNGDDSSKYRNKIQALVSKLNEVLEALKINNGEKKDIPLDKVESANQALITRTKANVENRIKREIQEGVEEKYTEQNGNCTVQPAGTHTHHNSLQNYVCIQSLIKAIETAITSKCETYKSHLDDLKQLCQWLYRMGQLYAHGLKGFIESLVKHLEHIHTVICWIEGIEKMVTKLKDISKEDGVAQTISDFNDIQYCCTTHQSLYNTNSTSFSNRDGFFTALNCRIDHLLTSYVLNELPDSTDKSDVDKRIKFLTDLRLLALDRYTLQVWQDECKKKDECKIKDWITFEGGIVRHSDLNAIKQQLSALTGIAYNNASSTTTAYSLTNRIQNFHAICVIQRFSYEAPIIRLERSLKELNKIKEKLNEVKKKCNSVTQDVSNVQDEQQVIQPFCQSVSQFLEEPYGVYSFAKFVHTIMGPNIFSAVIAALEELKDAGQYKKNDGNLDKIKGILGVMTEGLDGEKKKDTDYKLENICKKLEAFITTLRREYIFAYPVVTANKASLPAAPQPNPQPRNPKCDNDDHSKSAICHHCYPYLASIFIGSIPNLYRHCRLLYEMCKYEGIGKDGLWYNDVLHYYNSGLHYHDPCYQALGVYMSWRGWKVYKKGSDEATEKYDLSTTHKGIKMFQSLEAIVSIKDPFKDSDLKPLDQLFKAVMQHFKKEREKLRKKREQELKRAFEDKNKDSGLQFVAPPPVLPSTVRQVLFWLHEMDTNKAFYDAMSQHINTLCRQSSIPISHDTILHVLKLSITQCLEVLATIEDPGRQNADYLYDLYTEEHYYAYPTVNIPLFFYTFVEKLMGAFLELNFVCVQCEFRATEGGWSDCHIGKSEHSMEGQNCRCTKSHTKASPLIPVTVSGSVVCPRPLSAFLFSDQKNQLKVPTDPNSRLVYMSKGTMPCGFQLKNKAITDAATRSAAQSAPTPTPAPTSMTGSVLVEPLRKLVGGHVTGRHNGTTTNGINTLSTVIYLRDLLRYTLCLAVRPPWSMSENMAFFYRVTESWRNKKGVGSVTVAHPNGQLLGAIHAEIDLFPGTFDGTKLTSAVERFAGIEDTEHQKSKTSASASPSGSHQFDLRTLMGCQENTVTSSGTTPAKCSYYMFPLSLDVYTHFDHKNSRAYLSWILNFAFGIYGQLKALEEMMKRSACVRNASQSNPSDCPSLPMCPGVLTALYQSGSSFMDQKQLAKKDNAQQSITNTTTKKTCSDFHTVLSGLFTCNTASCSPLHNLIVQCEALLWSIRMPFSVVQLSLWSVAILFISYVFVVPLDHFKIKSHLFNRLKYTMHPSLLITDQQRRVSEVAYFSL